MLANLKTALAARGVKQADVALRLKIAPSVLSEIIHERRIASESVRTQLASELGVDGSWLFERHVALPGPRNFDCQPVPTIARAGRE